jgi:SnoaL-like domain
LRITLSLTLASVASVEGEVAALARALHANRLARMSEGAGRACADALGTKDWAAISRVLADDVDFRALTPNQFWEATGPQAVVDEVLRDWLDDERVTGVSAVEDGEVGDRHRVAYRIGIDGPDGPEIVEQQAYYEVADGRISWIRILCAGILPIAAD